MKEKDILRLVVPLPYKQETVNCYLLPGKDGWDVIDTGIHNALTRQTWQYFLQQHRIDPGEIHAIYITHYHPEHYGLAGWLQELTGAPVYIHSLEQTQIEQLWKKGRVFLPAVGYLLQENGMPGTQAVEVVERTEEILPLVQPHPVLHFFEDEQEIILGSHPFRIMHTPGHSGGHCCFYCEQEGWLFSGDHIVSPGNAGVFLLPTSSNNPMESLLSSLERIGCLGIQQVFPGHGEIFTDCAEKVDILLKHYNHCLRLVEDLTKNETTAYAICMAMFDTLDLRVISFGMAEVLAYLAYLESRGRVISRQQGEHIFYKKA